MKFTLPYSFSYKRKLCFKRLQKRKIEMYRKKVDQIIADGHTDLNGTVFTSIADLTTEFYI